MHISLLSLTDLKRLLYSRLTISPWIERPFLKTQWVIGCWSKEPPFPGYLWCLNFQRQARLYKVACLWLVHIVRKYWLFYYSLLQMEFFWYNYLCFHGTVEDICISERPLEGQIKGMGNYNGPLHNWILFLLAKLFSFSSFSFFFFLSLPFSTPLSLSLPFSEIRGLNLPFVASLTFPPAATALCWTSVQDHGLRENILLD